MITRGYVSTSAGQVHYRVAGARGDQRRPLVLMHQTASSSVMFEPLMQRLATRRFVVAPDAPGFGGSDALSGRATIARYADVLLEALTRLELGVFDLFGHHSGAAIAVELAVTYPQRVSRLALSGPPYLTQAQLERLVPTVTPFVPDTDGKHLLAVWRRVRAKDPSAPLDLSQREAVLTLVAGERYPEAYQAVFAHDFAGQLARVAQTTLVMAGPDDTIFDSLEPAFRALRRGSKCVLSRGGTYVCDREPDLVAAALTDFFTEEEAP
jgi:pimeloyl-ACP methyl ester carboxylesterase